jgi:hypothetical protein
METGIWPAGPWLKGNTHVHTTRSDGGWTPAEAAARYASAGYDFICITDHWAAYNEGTDGSRTHPSLLVLDGIELDGHDAKGSYYHVICLGTFRGIDREMGLEAAIGSAREQGGFIVLAHPFWTGNSVEESLRHGFHAVEAYNHVCTWLNGKGSSLYHWDAMLESAPGTLGLAVDDAHVVPAHPGWNGGWVMVAAEGRSPKAVTAALRSGRFYSTCGPEIRDVRLNGGKLLCTTSPARFARLVGPRFHGNRQGSFEGSPRTEFEIDVPEGCSFLRLEIEDERGLRAWTNPLPVTGSSSR